MCSRTQKLTVVLASASPRRTELLEQGNIKHVVMPSHCEEVITSQVPSQVVEELSVQKAEDVYQQYETIRWLQRMERFSESQRIKSRHIR